MSQAISFGLLRTRHAISRRGALGISVALLLMAPRPACGEADHAQWDQLLQRYVKAGRVDYQGLKGARAALESYLASLKEASPERLPSREAKLAFWINAYNACVVQGVLDHQPIKSVKDVKGFFDRIRYPVAGQELTLNDIEKAGWALGDWRIHMAIVCASTSCPPLRSEAYLPERLNDQLSEQATIFLQDPQRGLRVEGSTLWLSQIFKWYQQDVLPERGSRLTPEALLPVIRSFLKSDVIAAIKTAHLTIKFLDYDWSLNTQ